MGLSGSTGCGAGTGARARTTAQHGGDTRGQGFIDLLGADEMDMGVKSASSHDLAFTRDDIRAGTDDHIGMNAIHNVGIASLADSNDHTMLDTNIRLVNARPIND